MTEPITYTLAEATKVSGISRTGLYRLIGAGKLDARKAGGRTLILASSLRGYIASLPVADIRVGQSKTA